MEVEPYLFEPERSLGESNIVGEIEDSVEMDPFRAAWVGNDIKLVCSLTTINVLIC